MHPSYKKWPKKNIDDSFILVTERLDIRGAPVVENQKICKKLLLKAILIDG